MAAHDGATVKLPKGVSVTIGGKTYRGECPDKLLVPEHKLRNVSEKKKPPGGKGN